MFGFKVKFGLMFDKGQKQPGAGKIGAYTD